MLKSREKNCLGAILLMTCLSANAQFFFFPIPLPNTGKPQQLTQLIEALEKSNDTKAVASVSEDKTFGSKYWNWGYVSGEMSQEDADRIALASCTINLDQMKSQSAGGKPMYDFGKKNCELHKFKNKTVKQSSDGKIKISSADTNYVKIQITDRFGHFKAPSGWENSALTNEQKSTGTVFIAQNNKLATGLKVEIGAKSSAQDFRSFVESVRNSRRSANILDEIKISQILQTTINDRLAYQYTWSGQLKANKSFEFTYYDVAVDLGDAVALLTFWSQSSSFDSNKNEFDTLSQTLISFSTGEKIKNSFSESTSYAGSDSVKASEKIEQIKTNFGEDWADQKITDDLKNFGIIIFKVNYALDAGVVVSSVKASNIKDMQKYVATTRSNLESILKNPQRDDVKIIEINGSQFAKYETWGRQIVNGIEIEMKYLTYLVVGKEEIFTIRFNTRLVNFGSQKSIFEEKIKAIVINSPQKVFLNSAIGESENSDADRDNQNGVKENRVLGGEKLIKSELQICQGADKSKWYKCFGVVNEPWGSYIGEFENGVFQGKGKATFSAGSSYAGEFKDGKANGFGKYQSPKGEIYVGEFKDYMNHGKGILLDKNGSVISEGIFEFGKIVRAEKTGINLTSDQSEKLPHERSSSVSRLNLEISNTQPNSDGDFIISINTNSDTSSLKINDEEFGGRSDGKYSIKRVARAGQETQFTIVAKDITGKSETKKIEVSRVVVESKVVYAPLNSAQVKRQTERDAVAIIIGIANYKSLPKAEFANDDARVFYDYAIRALGVKPENIKLLVDGDAEDVEIIKTFKTWLPSRVKSTTDVYVFYSGHGLPTQDGQGLYLLPPRADRDFISRTAIQFQEINADLQAAKPKSVTIFMDACYSGQARSGEALIANARPVTLKAEKKLFPDNFTVIAASQADQISSSSPDLKHGIFSYYLMKGMEGDADTNKDGKITLGEMQAYLIENVGRQAGMMSRKQEPQLIGDVNRVLIGR